MVILGENVRPNYYNYDFSLSFDISDYGGRICLCSPMVEILNLILKDIH